ncbi:MAG TPA: hemerythrin domain-containing protein [Candidatus Nanoarchaeia archaeon]|nr:hemerythrin domain-containing protein [Candidatus Nanoarchaeia archaeon]
MTNNNPTDILKEEHQHILAVIKALEKECSTAARGKLNKSFFQQAIYFIRNYADKFHHAKEEDILFFELCKDQTQEKMHCNPVQQMLVEHDSGRQFVKGMEEGLENDDKKSVIENANGYASLLREHIFKEDNILYPMADEVLDDSEQKRIKKKFAEAEAKLAKVKDECLAFVKKID